MKVVVNRVLLLYVMLIFIFLAMYSGSSDVQNVLNKKHTKLKKKKISYAKIRKVLELTVSGRSRRIKKHWSKRNIQDAAGLIYYFSKYLEIPYHLPFGILDLESRFYRYAKNKNYKCKKEIIKEKKTKKKLKKTKCWVH